MFTARYAQFLYNTDTFRLYKKVVLGDTLIGPVALPNRLSGAIYCRFLFSGVQAFLEYISVYQTQHVLFFRHGTPHLFLRIVRERLNYFQWEVDWAWRPLACRIS